MLHFGHIQDGFSMRARSQARIQDLQHDATGCSMWQPRMACVQSATDMCVCLPGTSIAESLDRHQPAVLGGHTGKQIMHACNMTLIVRYSLAALLVVQLWERCIVECWPHASSMVSEFSEFAYGTGQQI